MQFSGKKIKLRSLLRRSLNKHLILTRQKKKRQNFRLSEKKLIFVTPDSFVPSGKILAGAHGYVGYRTPPAKATEGGLHRPPALPGAGA